MPNWCNNKVKVFGEAEQLAKVAQIFKDEKSIFNNIIQSPDWKRLPNEKGQFPQLEQHKNPKTGEVMWETYNFPDGKNDDRWYHWCIENWGTKWELSELDIEYDDEVLELTFSTAWSPPEGIMEELKDKYPDLGFSCFYDEPGMEIAGYY